MFEFRSVELMNWAYWPTVKLPLDQRTIMITGPNGSGKTTFLDALRTLLRAPRLSANRRFTDYLIGNVETAAIRAVVGNDLHQREHRPFEFKGCLSPEVTLAVQLKQKAGRWERRYAILDGDVPMETIRHLRTGELLSPEAFTYEIAQAGFSEAFLKVLALEQGQTDKLCEKSPRELLDLLLDVHGDKTVIERYKQARENYQSANLELTQLGARLAEEQSHLLTSQRAAEDYARWVRLHQELKQFEEVLIPQAEYRAAKTRCEELNLAINDLNLRLKPVDREIVKAQEILDTAEAELERRKREVLAARGTRDDMEKRERELDIALSQVLHEKQELEALLAAAGAHKTEPLGPLKQQLEEARRELVRLELREEELKGRLEQQTREFQAADRKQEKIYPGFVGEFRRVLDQAGIDYQLVCDLIEVTEPAWQLAVESILGRDRFTVIVPPDQQAAARKLGERHRYRCYVVTPGEGRAAARKPVTNSALDVVRLLDDQVPEWVVENLARTRLVESVEEGMKLGKGTTSVTRQGYRQDQRGGLSIAVDSFHCGSLGQTASREELGRSLGETQTALRALGQEKSARRMTAQSLLARLDAQAALGRVDEARARVAQLTAELPAANATHQEALLLKRAAEEKVFAALEDLNRFESDLTLQQRIVNDRRGDQSEYLDEIKELQDTVRELTGRQAAIAERLHPDRLTERGLRDVPDLDELTPRYYSVKNLLAEYKILPEEGAVEVYEHHKSSYERHRKLYTEHEAGLRNWETEFRLARQKYLVVVDHTIREYRKNILALSDLAGVNAEVAIPSLTEYENNLENAELVVRFGYDGKRATAIGGSGHSGGQRVVSSLILLMSLATSGGINRGGFFIIDEPFAHLSLERIDDVSRFLDKTQCQFILTSPTTHNVNVFSAARLQLNFRIKRPADQYAAIPTVIRR